MLNSVNEQDLGREFGTCQQRCSDPKGLWMPILSTYIWVTREKVNLILNYTLYFLSTDACCVQVTRQDIANRPTHGYEPQ